MLWIKRKEWKTKGLVKIIHGVTLTLMKYEVNLLLKKATLKESVRIANIPYEIMNNSLSVNRLMTLSSKIVLSHVNTLVWHQSIVKPIHKNSNTNPTLPHEYRGFTFLPTV